MEKNNRLMRAARTKEENECILYSDHADLISCVDADTRNNLLQIAVSCQNVEVFYHLLAIEDYPLNHTNKRGQTALNICFDDGYVYSFSSYLKHPKTLVLDYLARALIKKGISLDCVTLRRNETLLHYALEHTFVNVPILLMDMGYDVNARCERGFTPLWLCVKGHFVNNDQRELVAALLCYGADPTMEMSISSNGSTLFEHVVEFRHFNHDQETLINLLVDNYTSMDVSFQALIVLARIRSPHFRSVVEHTNNVIIKDSLKFNHHYLLKIDRYYLNILITTFPDLIREISCDAVTLDELMDCGEHEARFLENLILLFESDLRDCVIEVIEDQLNAHMILQDTTDESVAFERICFLLSYGIKIDEYTLNSFYAKFGFGDLFKVVADMELQPLICKVDYPYEYDQFTYYSYPTPIYSVNFDLQRTLDNLTVYQDFMQALNLLDYFCDARLRQFCFHYDVSRTSRIATVAENQPQIPLLVELARNVCQKFLVDTFQIETPMQFYKLVNRLPIPSEIMKIIRLERKLY